MLDVFIVLFCFVFLPSAACITLTSSPLKVLLASSSRAHSGEDGVLRPFRTAFAPATFSSTRGGHRLVTDFFTDGLFKISSMLNGVRGLLELAGGGSWSKGPRLLSSLPDCNTEPAFMSLLEVMTVLWESVKKVVLFRATAAIASFCIKPPFSQVRIVSLSF